MQTEGPHSYYLDAYGYLNRSVSAKSLASFLLFVIYVCSSVTPFLFGFQLYLHGFQTKSLHPFWLQQKIVRRNMVPLKNNVQQSSLPAGVYQVFTTSSTFGWYPEISSSFPGSHPILLLSVLLQPGQFRSGHSAYSMQHGYPRSFPCRHPPWLHR